MTLGPVLAGAYTVGLALLFVLRAESLPRALPRYSPAERWSVLVTPFLITAHVTLACVVVSALGAVPGLAAALSLGVFTGGLAFWVWARVQIGPLRVSRLPDEPPLRLRRDGPFGFVRNPLYFGLLVMIAAPLLVTRRPVLLFTYVLCVVALGVRAVQDERRLHDQLGDAYATYCREVRRLIPFVW